jgi:flagellar FliL protein
MANEQEAAPEEGAPQEPSKKLKMPVLIGMIAVGLAVGGGTGAMFIGPMVAKKMGKTAVVAAADSAKGEGDAAAEGEHAAGGEEKGKEGAAGEASVHLLDNLVLNPAGSGGSRFLLLSVALEVGSAGNMEQFKARDAELRDIILTSLGNKTVDQLTDMTRREQFKSEIQAAVDERFGKKAVKRLYFPQFVVQ